MIRSCSGLTLHVKSSRQRALVGALGVACFFRWTLCCSGRLAVYDLFCPAFTGANFGPGYRPGLSPYLNLLRGGNTAANYYLGTIPEFQRRQNANFFSSSIADLQARTTPQRDDLPDAPPVRSGTTPYLANTGGFFANTAGFFPPVTGRQPGAPLAMPAKKGRTR